MHMAKKKEKKSYDCSVYKKKNIKSFLNKNLQTHFDNNFILVRLSTMYFLRNITFRYFHVKSLILLENAIKNIKNNVNCTNIYIWI